MRNALCPITLRPLIPHRSHSTCLSFVPTVLLPNCPLLPTRPTALHCLTEHLFKPATIILEVTRSCCLADPHLPPDPSVLIYLLCPHLSSSQRPITRFFSCSARSPPQAPQSSCPSFSNHSPLLHSPPHCVHPSSPNPHCSFHSLPKLSVIKVAAFTLVLLRSPFSQNSRV